MLTVERPADGAAIVTVLPITHGPTADPTTDVELTVPVKRHLGLYAERSWIIVSQEKQGLSAGL